MDHRGYGHAAHAQDDRVGEIERHLAGEQPARHRSIIDSMQAARTAFSRSGVSTPPTAQPARLSHRCPRYR